MKQVFSSLALVGAAIIFGIVLFNTFSKIVRNDRMRNQRVKILTLEDAYKRGQVDAIHGLIRYHLVTNEFQEVIWEKIVE